LRHGKKLAKLPLNVGFFKIIKLYRPNYQKIKNFFWYSNCFFSQI
jgi:hypothetical protein